MNYHTDLLPSPRKQLPAKNENLVINRIPDERKIYLFFKRSADALVALIMIGFVLSWLLPILGLLIIMDSRGPVFFIQRRIGKNGRSFACLKFRTMIVNDEADVKQAEKDDYRITRLGKFLRKTNLDELPQFVNILIGDMSIIGPRPHMFSDYTRFSFVIPGYKFRNLMRPGITGLAQVKGHHGPTRDYDSILARYSWDAKYIRNAGFMLDLKIVLLTILRAIVNFCFCAFCLFLPIK
jgi:putative colanic acid biosynthesis UDP-glucose lipid carrier transferase